MFIYRKRLIPRGRENASEITDIEVWMSHEREELCRQFRVSSKIQTSSRINTDAPPSARRSMRDLGVLFFLASSKQMSQVSSGGLYTRPLIHPGYKSVRYFGCPLMPLKPKPFFKHDILLFESRRYNEKTNNSCYDITQKNQRTLQ